VKAPLPQNETARLRALRQYAVLDSLEEQAFNDITMLASFICEAPIALLTLVDGERQWFKSRVGLQATQTPREHAFCAHAILQPQEVMVVNDAMSDARFVDNPLVTGNPHIRFYAGAPLVTPNGDALGTICVIDRTPRDLPARKIEALRALSRQVVAQLELRRVVVELNRSAIELQSYQRQLERYQKQIETANTTLETQSTTDGLTGVKNRRAFDHALHEEFARASREKTSVSLLLVDIDKFKPYNDEFGHLAGDEALREVARILAVHARPFDVVARYGGEEFAVVLPHTGVEESVIVGERLRRAIETAPWSKRAITVSVGASTTGSELDSTALLAQADQALYQIKQRGGNQIAHTNQCA
jgi:diguanylate cyclase (GGDEF)-like protein